MQRNEYGQAEPTKRSEYFPFESLVSGRIMKDMLAKHSSKVYKETTVMLWMLIDNSIMHLYENAQIAASSIAVSPFRPIFSQAIQAVEKKSWEAHGFFLTFAAIWATVGPTSITVPNDPLPQEEFLRLPLPFSGLMS